MQRSHILCINVLFSVFLYQSIRTVCLFFCNSQYSKQVMFNYNEIFSLSNLQLKCRKNKSKPTSQNLRDPPIATTCACLCSWRATFLVFSRLLDMPSVRTNTRLRLLLLLTMSLAIASALSVYVAPGRNRTFCNLFWKTCKRIC